MQIRKMQTSYRLPLEEDPDVEHGFVENFCRLLICKEDWERWDFEFEEKGYTTKYTPLMGNCIFNATVYNRNSSLKSCSDQLLKN